MSRGLLDSEIHEGIILRRTNDCQSYILLAYYLLLSNQNQIKKFYLKSVHFITIQHKLSRAFQTDIYPIDKPPVRRLLIKRKKDVILEL
jgi:hypothetical protein